MTKILYSQSTGATLRYPRTDDQPIVGLDPDYVVLEQVKVAQPTYDPETQTIASQYVADLSAGEYRQEWVVTDRLAEPNWDGFNATILADVAFNQATATVMQTAPAVALAIPAALAQVSTNGVSAFSMVFQSFCQIANVSDEQRTTWGDLAAGYNLPSEFVNVITAG